MGFTVIYVFLLQYARLSGSPEFSRMA